MRRAALGLLFAACVSSPVVAQVRRPAPAARPAPNATPPKLQIDINVGAPISTTVANQDFSTVINQEDASITNDINLRGGGFADVGVAYRVSRSLWIGGTLSLVRRTVQSDLVALVPHPFYFDQPRRIDATVDGLTNRETNIHAAAGYQAPLSRSADITFFGGPSLFRITQDVVTAIRYDSTYPFDTATFASATTDTVTGALFGFNAGAHVNYHLSRAFAIAGLVRFERGVGTLDAGSGNEIQTTVGGLKAGVGVRVSFCSSRSVPPRRRGGLLLC